MNTYRDYLKAGKLKMWVDLSTYCNAGCPQCHRTSKNKLEKEEWLPLIQWSLDQFKKAFPVESLHRYDRFELCGTWGDPVMNKDIFHIVKYLIDNSECTIQINSNAGIRDSQWWWDLGVMGGERLETWFDIDGIDQEMHSLYRQKVDLEKVKENVEAYCSTNARSAAFVIVFKHNQDYLWEIYELIRSLGIKGEVFFTESNRFYHSDTFTFLDENGNEKKLEQSTLNGNHYLLDNTIPIRDHKWRKKYVADGNKTNDYW